MSTAALIVGIVLLYCCFVVAAVHLIVGALPVDEDGQPITTPEATGLAPVAIDWHADPQHNVWPRDPYGLPPMRKGE
jgi:hypothetical protein